MVAAGADGVDELVLAALDEEPLSVLFVLPESELPVVLVALLPLEAPPPFLFELPEYASAYQPLPLRMKLPPLIWRRACSLWQSGHSLIGSSLMR